MEQFRTEAFQDGTGAMNMRITCTYCAATINFFNPRHAQYYRDIHAEKCNSGFIRKQERCPQVFVTVGPTGLEFSLECILAAGHPVGPEFDFFTDYNGHIWPKPESQMVYEAA